MGNLCPCLDGEGSYTPVRGDENVAIEASKMNAAASSSSSNGAVASQYFHAVADTVEEANQAKEFDLNSPVFAGSVVDQKFSNKSTYDQKFVWINIDSRTLNLSEYRTKEKRHKEASLTDVVNVVAGPPEKFKATVSETGEVEKLNVACCMSVTFVRGGGIDLKFKTEAERDAWYVAITKLMVHQKAAETSPTARAQQ